MENKKIAVIGLGYVGLPLAVEFGKKFDTIGFDPRDICLEFELTENFWVWDFRSSNCFGSPVSGSNLIILELGYLALYSFLRGFSEEISM